MQASKGKYNHLLMKTIQEFLRQNREEILRRYVRARRKEREQEKLRKP